MNDDVRIPVPDWLLETLPDLSGIDGCLAEIGVYRGESAKRILRRYPGRAIHLFDSFVGLADPGPRDDAETYPRGRFDVGGEAGFVRFMRDIPANLFSTHAGFVPDCFVGCEHLRFVLVHIDLDHYEPTLRASRFAWDHLSTGGLLIYHDYFTPEHGMASAAEYEFLGSVRHETVAEIPASIVVRKLG